MGLDPNRFQDALKRTLEASKAAEKRAMESGDTSELDQVEQTMTRLERIGQSLQQKPGVNDSGMPTDAQFNAVTQDKPEVMQASQGAWRAGQEKLAAQKAAEDDQYANQEWFNQIPYTPAQEPEGIPVIDPVSNTVLRGPLPEDPKKEQDWYKQVPAGPVFESIPSVVTAPKMPIQTKSDNFEVLRDVGQKIAGAAIPFISPFVAQIPGMNPPAHPAEPETTPANPAVPPPVAGPTDPEFAKKAMDAVGFGKATPEQAAQTDIKRKLQEAISTANATPSQTSFDEDYKQFLKTVGLEQRNIPFLERLVQSILDAGDIGLNQGRGYAARKQAQTARDSQRLQAAQLVQGQRASKAKAAAAGISAVDKAKMDARKLALRYKTNELNASRRILERKVNSIDDNLRSLQMAYGPRLTDAQGQAAYAAQAKPLMDARNKHVADLEKLEKNVYDATSLEYLEDAEKELGLNY